MMPNLSIQYRPPAELKPNPRNARTHSKAQIRKIAASIREFGFTNPILIDNNDTIIAGHGRVSGATLVGVESVPTIRLESLTPAQIQAYVLADNRLCLDAGWDKEILRIELQNLIVSSDIDIELTGFEIAEIDQLLVVEDEQEADDVPPLSAGPVISKPGDVWSLGRHRIACGDARDESLLSALMQDLRAGVVFTDPPFNVAIDGHASGNGKVHHEDFAMASGEMSKEEFTAFLAAVFDQLAKWSTDGSVHFIAQDWRHMNEMLAAGEKVYDSLLNLCVWAKDNGGMGSFYRSQHELFFVFRKGKGQHRNNIQLGRFGRNRTNVWRYPGANTLSRTGADGNLLAMHPTVKPIALVADALLDCSAREDVVLDLFLGAGTTLLAAERMGRICHGVEIEPRYVDLAIRRWQEHTGESAIHASTGVTFEALAAKEALRG